LNCSFFHFFVVNQITCYFTLPFEIIKIENYLCMQRKTKFYTAVRNETFCFILQVHKNQSTRGRGGGGGKTTSSDQKGQAASSGSGQPDVVAAGVTDRDISVVAPETTDRVVNWVNQAQASGPPARDRGRGRKKRLAANFQTE
jgi:hypothetical protein